MHQIKLGSAKGILGKSVIFGLKHIIMQVEVLAFGIAKDIIGSSAIEFEIAPGDNIEELKSKLIREFPGFEKLRSFSLAVNQEYQEDDFLLSEKDEIAIIPPVSGG